MAAHDWGIYRSTDNGANWDSVKGGFPSPQTYTFLSHSSDIFAGGRLDFFPMLLKTTNDGVTWNNVSPTGFLSGGITSLVSSSSIFFCTVTGRGVYSSTDFGSSWTIINTGIASPNFANNFFVKGENAFVSANGLWKRPLSQITSLNNDLNFDLPKSYSLCQNYPNPFNPSTMIRYSIPSSEFVKLKVFDLLGNEIITLVDEVKLPGEHEVIFKGENLPSSIYFYQIQTESFSQTKKMIFIK